MIPIRCPCGSSDWKLVETPQKTRNRETLAYIREDSEPMKQVNCSIVSVVCNDCSKYFWIDELQAECVIEEFM